MHLSLNLFIFLSCQDMMLHFWIAYSRSRDWAYRHTVNESTLVLSVAGAISQAGTFTNSNGAEAGTGLQPASLDLAQLDKLVEKFIMKSLAESTHHSYHSGQTYFLTFY